MKPRIIACLVLAILLFVVLIQNTQIVTVRLFFWKIGMAQILLILLTMLIGFVVGYGVARVTGDRQGRRTKV